MDEDWLKQLDEYDVQYLVLNLHTDSDLVALFQSEPGWAVDFEDGEAIIFVRVGSPYVHVGHAGAYPDIPIAA